MTTTTGTWTQGPRWSSWAGLAGDGQVLELAIGIGRVALPLAAARGSLSK